MLMRYGPYCTLAVLEKMVIPRSFSSVLAASTRCQGQLLLKRHQYGYAAPTVHQSFLCGVFLTQFRLRLLEQTVHEGGLAVVDFNKQTDAITQRLLSVRTLRRPTMRDDGHVTEMLDGGGVSSGLLELLVHRLHLRLLRAYHGRGPAAPLQVPASHSRSQTRMLRASCRRCQSREHGRRPSFW